MKKLTQKIKTLTQVRGVSGYEESASELLFNMFSEIGEGTFIDPLGSVHTLIKCGEEGAPLVILDAHIDEIGLMVTKITDEGFIKFCNIGGVDFRILPASTVTIHAKREISGVVASQPPHLSKEKEREKSIPADELIIDVGLTKAEASELLSVGDIITLDGDLKELLGGKITGRGFDDRLGLAAILEAASLTRGRLSVDLELLASAGEETFLSGARAAGFSSAAALAIAVDVTHGKTPDASPDEAFPLGGGAMIGCGPNLHKRVVKRFLEIAKKKDIPHGVEVMGGSTGTNAWALQTAGAGMACGLLSIPLRYMHTTTETVSVKDIEATVRLLCEFLKSLRREDF